MPHLLNLLIKYIASEAVFVYLFISHNLKLFYNSYKVANSATYPLVYKDNYVTA